MTTHELVKKVIGEIYPVGDESVDPKRLDNLKEMMELVELLIADIHEISYRNGTRYEDSIKKAVKLVDSFMITLIPEN